MVTQKSETKCEIRVDVGDYDIDVVEMKKGEKMVDSCQWKEVTLDNGGNRAVIFEDSYCLSGSTTEYFFRGKIAYGNGYRYTDESFSYPYHRK